MKAERKQIEREVRAEMRAKAEEKSWTFDDAIEELEKKLKPFGDRQDAERLAEGWTKAHDGYLLPPGYGPLPGFVPPPREEEQGEAPRDSM